MSICEITLLSAVAFFSMAFVRGGTNGISSPFVGVKILRGYCCPRNIFEKGGASAVVDVVVPAALKLSEYGMWMLLS